MTLIDNDGLVLSWGSFTDLHFPSASEYYNSVKGVSELSNTYTASMVDGGFRVTL